MKIEIKNIKVAEHLSEETTAFTADIFVNGKKAGYARNDGRGGDTDCNAYPEQRELLRQAADYCLTLPPRILKSSFAELGEIEVKMNLTEFVDEAIDKHLAAKEQKKLEKRMVNSLLIGVPGGNSYKQISFNKPLSEILPLQLQTYVNKYKKEMKEGEKFLNTNLEKLGIKI